MKFSKASRIAENHDVVLVGYRGVDGSVRLDCPEVVSALKRSEDFLGAEVDPGLHRRLSGVRGTAAGRRRRSGRLRAARPGRRLRGGPDGARVRADRPVSESAGTRTAMIYAWRYPKSIHRSVMIGVNPPGHFLWDPKVTDEQIRRYARYCAADAACSKRTETSRRPCGGPRRIRRPASGACRSTTSNARIASFYGLMESTPDAAPLSGPMTIDAWLAAAEGDASGLWFESLLARLAFPESFVWGELPAAGMADRQAREAVLRDSAGEPHGSIIGNPGTDFILAGGGLADAWPAKPDDNEYTRVQTRRCRRCSSAATLDFATPPQIATRELLPHLPNGHQVVLAGLGHADSFWSESRRRARGS